jgi:hypothetical protein
MITITVVSLLAMISAISVPVPAYTYLVGNAMGSQQPADEPVSSQPQSIDCWER